MEYLLLILGLLLPWLVGYLWLAAIEQKLSAQAPKNLLRQLGYGLFLGYGALQGIVLLSASVFEPLTVWPVFAALAVLTTLPAIYLKASSSNSTARQQGTVTTTHHPATTSPPLSTPSKILLFILMAWATAHLAMAAIEIFNRPVYPWDAWLSWAYRAKTWYYNHTVFQLAHPTEWLQGTASTPYNVAGNHYPGFASVMAFWAALLLGQWSETLVNSPVLLCGIALSMATYGQCREYGTSPLLATAAAYLLLSTPLMGTHLALAGQADIWMAGFAGLGFIALIRGLTENNKTQLALGLVMVALTMGNKVEGIVWFAAALMLVPIVKKPRLSLWVSALAAALALLAWLLGVSSVELPLLGTVGVSNGALHLPLVGAIPLQQFEVWDSYLRNFFVNGTWHLLWPFVLLSIPAVLLSQPKGQIRLAVIGFYLVFVITQGIIFWLTAQGQWAADSTAINRLPMHAAPALIFCLILVAHGLLKKQNPKQNKLTQMLPPGIAAVLTGLLVVAYLYANTAGSNATPRQFSAKKMQIVVGGGGLQNGVGIIQQFKNGIAIVSSGPIELNADTLGTLMVETGGTNSRNAGFFWRRQNDTANVESVALSTVGEQIIDLSQNPVWQGTITELGLIFYQDQANAAQLHSLQLAPKTPGTEMNKAWHDWTQFEPWSQASAHWIAGGARNTRLSLPLLMTCWLALTLALYLLQSSIVPSKKIPTLALALCLLAGWILLDVRWSINSIRQNTETLTYFQAKEPFSFLDLADDRKIAQLVHEAKQHMSNNNQQVLIFSADPKMRFHMFRAKYQLLPTPGLVYEGDIANLPKRVSDYILMLNPLHMEPGRDAPGPDVTATMLQKRLGAKVAVVWASKAGALFQTSTHLQNEGEHK
jgi:hypothetical protein